MRHIARVEWVTVQVRWSQSRAGGEKEEDEDEDEDEAYLEGMRRVMGCDILAVCYVGFTGEYNSAAM